MSSANCIQIIFSLMTSSIIIVGSLVNTFEKYLPSVVVKSFRYGKFAFKGNCKIKTIEVPKSYFKHFYRVAVIFSSASFLIIFKAYVLNEKVPTWYFRLVQHLSGGVKYPTVSANEVFLAMTLLSFQCYRRFYDTHFVSIFGKNSKINISHYIIGIAYYPLVILAILSEAPKFTQFGGEKAILNVSDFNIFHLFAVIFFLWAWWHQHICTVILANLRKTKDGTILKDGYKLPEGDWFKHLSSPHSSAEILMYFALTVLLWKSFTWWFVLGWVIGNQIETILLSHWWYQETFKNFPQERKALIPFIY